MPTNIYPNIYFSSKIGDLFERQNINHFLASSIAPTIPISNTHIYQGIITHTFKPHTIIVQNFLKKFTIYIYNNMYLLYYYIINSMYLLYYYIITLSNNWLFKMYRFNTLYTILNTLYLKVLFHILDDYCIYCIKGDYL